MQTDKATKSRSTRAESRQSASDIAKVVRALDRHAAGHRSDPGARSQPQGRRRPAARRRQNRRHQSRETLLAEAEADERRPAPLLRVCRAAHPARRGRSSARDEAISERRRRSARLLSAAQAEGAAARRRAHRDAACRHRSDRRARHRTLHRRVADHAALHDAACGDLAGPVVLARAVAARRRLHRRSISIRARARRSRRCSTSRAGCATSSRR